MKPIKLEIGDCNETDAFLTNEEGFDVACLSRYTPTSHGVGSNEHIAHLLTDEQWQVLINRVNAHDELVAALRRAVSIIEDLPFPENLPARDLERLLSKLEGGAK
jgi:hypothetical protein